MPDRLRAGLGLVTLVAVVLFCALGPIADLDVFTHLTIGRWIVEHRALPQTNLWSAATPAGPYHCAQWLWDAGAALIDRRLGLEGLRVGNAIWIVASVSLLYLGLRRRTTTAAALLVSLLVFVAFQDRVRLRPHVVDLGVQILLLVVVLRAGPLRRTQLAGVALGFFVWASLYAQGAGIAVLLVLAMAIVRFTLDRRRVDLLLLAAAATLGWLLSPGALGWLTSFDHAALDHPEELRIWPALFVGILRRPHALLVRALLPIAALAWGALALRWRRAEEAVRTALGAPQELVWAALCILLAASSWRFFYFAALALVALLLAKRRLDEAQARPIPRARLRACLVVAGAIFVAVLALRHASVGYPSLAEAWGSRRDTLDDRYLPSLGVELLVESLLEARVGTLPAWGGYVSYLGWPKLRPTIDSRLISSVEVEALTKQIQQIYDSGEHVELLPELFEQLPADFLLVPRRHHTARLTLPHWAKVSTGAVEDLWLRKTPASAAWVETLRLVIERHRLSGLPGHKM